MRRVHFVNPFSIMLIVLLTCSLASASVMSIVKTVAGADSFLIGVVTVALLFALRAMPNDRIQAAVGSLFYSAGVTITLILGKYKWSAPFWNNVVEPFFVDLLRNTVQTAVNKLIEGVESDNNAK